jgi:hypothetical protein
VDQIYDLVSGNIGSEIRAKIDDIGKKIAHPLAQPVAKVICLLQYVRSVHRTAENIAAALHPGDRCRFTPGRGPPGPRCPGEGPHGPPRRRRLPDSHPGRG